MKALLDTHAALFAWSSPDKLSKRVREIILNKKNELLLSQVSTIEIALKYKIGKLELPMTPVEYVASRVQLFAFQYISLEDVDISVLSELPLAHRDPFDWLLLATARRLELPIISCDKAFKAYPIKLIW